MYNKSLCFAQTDVMKSLAHNNRSIVCLQLKMFDECIFNINFAFKFNYPAEKAENLHKRIRICNQLMASGPPRENLWDLIKLSYPANEKVPYVIESLELCEIEGFNRKGICTNRALKAGDIIAIDELFLTRPTIDNYYKRCINCFAPKIATLHPCVKYSEYGIFI